jgi:hypothetical protein
MYGFNDSIPLNHLVGLTLTQLCVGANEFILRFDGNCSILVQSFDRFVSDNRLNTSGGRVLLPEGLGELVVECVFLDDRQAKISFKESFLLLSDDSQQFESIVFDFAGSRYVV